MPIYVVFIDVTKAFDTVSREGLWIVLRKLRCTDNVIKLIKSFHDKMQAQASYGSESTDIKKIWPSKGTEKWRSSIIKIGFTKLFLQLYVIDRAYWSRLTPGQRSRYRNLQFGKMWTIGQTDVLVSVQGLVHFKYILYLFFVIFRYLNSLSVHGSGYNDFSCCWKVRFTAICSFLLS